LIKRIEAKAKARIAKKKAEKELSQVWRAEAGLLTLERL